MMKKPTITVSSLRFAAGGRLWRNVLLALAVLLISFALGFRLFFPADLLEHRLEGEIARHTGARVELQRLSLGLPLSVTLHGLQIDSRQPPLPPLRVDRLALSPGWLSLVSGDPGVEMEGALYDGDLSLDLARSGRFLLELDGLQLGLLPAIVVSETPVRLGGGLSGRLSAAEPPLSQQADTAITLRIAGAVIDGLEPLGIADGRIRVGDLIAKGRMKGRRLEVEALRATGGDLRIDGQGTLLIGSDVARTRLNLQINLLPADSADPLLRDLISLSGSTPAPDGSYRLRLSGSLSRPVLR